MTYASRETSTSAGQPIELYAFQIADAGWFFTSGDHVVTYLGFDFAPETISRTAINQSGEAKAGQVKVTVPTDNPVAQQFKTFIPSTPMSVVIYRTHGTDGEFVVIFAGRVLAAMFGDFAELTVMPENDLLKYNVPSQQFQTQCNHFLYDRGCTVDKELYAVPGIVTGFDVGNVVIAPEFATKPDGWFAVGYVEFGFDRRMILSHVGERLTLNGSIPNLIVGSRLVAYAGCMRDFRTCGQKFGNAKNFAGYEWIPIRNPFTSSFA